MARRLGEYSKAPAQNCLRRLSVSINPSCHSEEHPKGTCFAARSNVGIRNLLVANSQKSVKIVRFGNRLPRQSADWLAMTGFFDSDKPSLWGQRFFYAGGARGGKARLESDQMSRKALPCKACVERSDYFRAARRHKNNDIISGCRKKPEPFSTA